MDYGNRPDGTKKGTGFFGVIKRPDGYVMTEISIGVGINGKETTIPLVVPALDKKELDYLMRANPKARDFQERMPSTIIPKAVDHAVMRMKEGKSPFIGEGEKPVPLPK